MERMGASDEGDTMIAGRGSTGSVTPDQGIDVDLQEGVRQESALSR